MEVEVVDEQVALVGGGGDDAITLGPEVADGIQSGPGTTVVVDGKPVGSSLGDFGVVAESVLVLDGVNVLDAEAIAGTEDGTAIVGMKKVLEHEGDVGGALADKAVEKVVFVVRHELAEVFHLFFQGVHHVSGWVTKKGCSPDTLFPYNHFFLELSV